MPDQLPFRIRRSAVQGKRPQNADLELGELALNTYDGRLFAKKDTGGVGIGTTVVSLTPWNENIGVGLYYNDGNVGLGTETPTSKLLVVGDSLVTGIATVGLGTTSTPPSNSQMSFELTSNTNLRVKVRGTDGVLRSGNITLT